MGIDSVVISNHGGRQIESLPAPIDVISEVRAAVGPSYPLILDSGIRSGEHILKALAAGADFVLLGRAMMFGIAGLGPDGAKIVIDMLRDETSRAMAQLGYTDIASWKAAAPIIHDR
jgi:isopentenyl diphosphate isomerase/L-lactate dehydrogenase-like FMN-dependent dehydrogenase